MNSLEMYVVKNCFLRSKVANRETWVVLPPAWNAHSRIVELAYEKKLISILGELEEDILEITYWFALHTASLMVN